MLNNQTNNSSLSNSQSTQDGSILSNNQQQPQNNIQSSKSINHEEQTIKKTAKNLIKEEQNQQLNQQQTQNQQLQQQQQQNNLKNQKQVVLSQEDIEYNLLQQERQKFFDQIFEKSNFKTLLTSGRLKANFLAGFSIHNREDPDYQYIKSILEKGNKKWIALKEENSKLDKSLAAFLGNAIGDALGAHTEFEYFKEYNKLFEEETWESLANFCRGSFRTNFGVITDDCSMARCMADSLLSNNMEFNPVDMRMRFLLWWNYGYCNGTLRDRSFGLGGNISTGFQTFIPNGMKPYVINDIKEYKKGHISGNGGIMRLSPIPIAYHDDIQKGEKIAVLQSLTTHNGYEAGELCKLLTHLVIKLINYTGNNPKADIIDKLGETFKSECPSVMCFANSKQEPEENMKLYHPGFNKSLADRYWDWKNKELKVSPTRHYQQPTYFGSYAMDGAYVAMHIVYHSNSQKEAIFKAVNWGGDSDSIAAVVGYITGAMYGLNADVLKLYYDRMLYFDDYSPFVKAYKLFSKHPIKTQAYYKKEGKEEDSFLF